MPVGLWGVFRISARVRGPNAAASRAGSKRQSGGASGTARTRPARHRDVGRVGVVGRLEHDHLVARIDDRQDGVVQQLGRAAGHGDLGVRIDRRASGPAPPVVVRQRPPQPRQAGAGRVLVAVLADVARRRLLDEVRRREVGEPLPQVGGAVLDRQGGDLGEDRRPDPGDARGPGLSRPIPSGLTRDHPIFDQLSTARRTMEADHGPAPPFASFAAARPVSRTASRPTRRSRRRSGAASARRSCEAWNRFSPGAAQTLRRLLGPGADREDLLQEVFLRFFKRIGTLREPAAVRGFLFGICVRVVQGEIASRHRRRWLRLTPTGETPETAVAGPDVEARDAIARYYALLERLGAERAVDLRGADDREADAGRGGRGARRVDLDGAAAPGAGHQAGRGAGADAIRR